MHRNTNETCIRPHEPIVRFLHEHLSSKLKIKVHKSHTRAARIPSKETQFELQTRPELPRTDFRAKNPKKSYIIESDNTFRTGCEALNGFAKGGRALE